MFRELDHADCCQCWKAWPRALPNMWIMSQTKVMCCKPRKQINNKLVVCFSCQVRPSHKYVTSVASFNEWQRLAVTGTATHTPTCILPLPARNLCGCLPIHNLLNIDVVVLLDLSAVIWWCCYHQWCARSVYPCTICAISWTFITAFSCGYSQLVGEESCYR